MGRDDGLDAFVECLHDRDGDGDERAEEDTRDFGGERGEGEEYEEWEAEETDDVEDFGVEPEG